MLFVYFVGDEEMAGPSTAEAWKTALSVVKHVMGLPKKSPLSRYIVEVFVDVASLKSSTVRP